MKVKASIPSTPNINKEKIGADFTCFYEKHFYGLPIVVSSTKQFINSMIFKKKMGSTDSVIMWELQLCLMIFFVLQNLAVCVCVCLHEMTIKRKMTYKKGKMDSKMKKNSKTKRPPPKKIKEYNPKKKTTNWKPPKKESSRLVLLLVKWLILQNYHIQLWLSRMVQLLFCFYNALFIMLFMYHSPSVPYSEPVLRGSGHVLPSLAGSSPPLPHPPPSQAHS